MLFSNFWFKNSYCSKNPNFSDYPKNLILYFLDLLQKIYIPKIMYYIFS